MRLEISISGDISKLMASEFRVGERAVSTAMRIAGDGLKADWRAQVVAAGFGVRLSKAVRSEVFPKGQASINAAALVYTKSPKIFDAHESGALIKARDGFWLAIPTKFAGKSFKGGRITPGEWQFRNGHKLRFVRLGTGKGMLVADDFRIHRASGFATKRKYRANDNRLGKLQSTPVPIFTLVPQVKLPKRLNLMAAGSAAQARVPGLIVSNWKGAV